MGTTFVNIKTIVIPKPVSYKTIPSGALTVLSGDEADVYQLLFKHNLCVACGQCVEVCPEQCLHLERTLETDELGSSAVLFDDELVRCAACGQPFTSRAMIASIRAKLPEATDPAQFELCPDCKMKSRLFGMKSSK